MPTQTPVAPPRRPPHHEPKVSRRALLVAGTAVVAVAALAIVLGRSTGDGPDAARPATTTSAAQAAAPASASSGSTTTTTAGEAAAASNATVNTQPGQQYFPTGDQPLPLDLSVSNTDGLADGDLVTIRATAKDNTPLYGFDARLCAAGQTYSYDADMKPTQMGKCISRPLSAQSEAYKQVAADASKRVVEGTFAVGTGTDTYSAQDGRPVTITCDRDHPCVLVLKLQFENGFGFRAVPLRFR